MTLIAEYVFSIISKCLVLYNCNVNTEMWLFIVELGFGFAGTEEEAVWKKVSSVSKWQLKACFLGFKVKHCGSHR